MKDALALALVHFVWQGALLAIVGALLMRVTRIPNVRYAIGVATMLAMLLAPVVTFLAIQRAADAASQAASTVAGSEAAIASGVHSLAAASVPAAVDAQRSGASVAVVIPTTWILNVWVVGVVLLSIRFVGGWAVARRLATETLTPAGEALEAMAAQMAARLNVRAAVRVCESASVAVPMMLGCLRPVIILPPAAVAALPLAQLEALLAHELAHIRRHDYLVNLLQTGVETLCFYHPAVWWISREVRRHREHCCDDIAVGVCDRLTYVTALSSLASLSTPQFALSAAGGSLRDRVRRLIEPTSHSASSKGAWIAMLPILLVISFVAPQAWSIQATTPAAAVPVASIAAPAIAAPTATEVIPAEQARPSTPAREAARAKAEDEREMASSERARVRELAEKGLAQREAASAKEIERVLEQLAAEVPKESAQRLELQRKARLALSESELAMLESQLREAEAAMSRQKELIDKGLASRQNLIAAEEQLNQLKLKIEQSKILHRMSTNELEVKEQLELRLTADRELERIGLGTTHRSLSALDSSATLEAQDRLTITIDGEPDLPTMFTVRPDGSIRFPFLGSIRVQGSTSSQVQSAIRKLISDKGLVRNPVVNVTAARAR